jgi:Ca2+-binding RTX toxin-like protein
MTSFNGTRGADLFIGTSECDQFYVNSYEDIIIGGGAGDSVVSSIDYVLNENITYLLLTGRAINGTGNNTENNVIGNRQDNVLNGGLGIDRLQGGAGRDTFVFDAGGRAHADYVMDFTSGTDRLAISGEAFGITAGAGFDYVEDWNLLGSAPAFIREDIQGLAPTIWFDADGQGGQDAQILCTLQRQRNSTTAADFAII